MSYEDAADLGGRAQSKAELAESLGLKAGEFDSGVWLGRIDISLIADPRFPTADELGANEWWVPGLRVPASWFELVIARLENLRQSIADGTVTFEKLM